MLETIRSNIDNQENILIDDERDYIEVRPHFEKLTPVEEGYPDGRMCAGKRKIIVDVLVPPSHPFVKLNNMVGCEDIKHRLEEFKSLADSGANLILCGHTHNGQIFPGNLVVPFFNENGYGVKELYGATTVVTAGVGYYGPPMRFGTDSEVTVVNVTFK